MVETRAARRKSMGPPADVPADQEPKTPSKKGAAKTTGDLHWSGSKKGGARGSSLFSQMLSSLAVIALIVTTPPLAVIV